MRFLLDFQQIDAQTLEIYSEGHAAHTVAIEDLRRIAAEPLTNQPEQMTDLGRRLYRLVNGAAGRLDALPAGATLELEFHVKPGEPAMLAHLPWELLHDQYGFLVRRGIVPVRVISFGPRRDAGPPAPPAHRPLNVLFMACSPRDAEPVLDFEAEERIILDATAKQPLYFTPEETGNVEELGETVRFYDAFDVFHLTGHGDLFDEERHKRFLAGQEIPQGRPVLLTETAHGYCHLAEAPDLAAAFGDRKPRLVFLSGCRTGELPGQSEAAHASMAQELLHRGFPCVLGWARPVLQDSATVAAGILYAAISSGLTVEQALRQTLSALSEPGAGGAAFVVPDWHLLRLFATTGSSQTPLVTPPGANGRTPYKPPRFDDGFLDKDGKKGKVAGFRRFVGRRRPLQRTLPAFDIDSGHTGVIVWGMGGLGKSSLAERLCDRVERRRTQFQRAVLVGLLNETRLLALLRSKYQRNAAALGHLKNGSLELQGKLENFFAEIDATAPLLLVLDDFENNIRVDAGAHDGFVLEPEAYAALEALGNAIRESRTQSRLILTARYWSENVYPRAGLRPEQLPQMDSNELRKKARNESGSEDGEKVLKRIGAAAGNPRRFEAQGEAAVAQFDKDLDLGSVLAALPAVERTQLARLNVFRLPVPLSVAARVAGDGEFVRAVGLGLAERTEPSVRGGEAELAVAELVRGLLEGVLSPEESVACHADAARAAHQAWWDDTEYPREAQVVEIVRLATLGGERKIACDRMEGLAVRWNDANRYRETVRWASMVLERFEDHRLLSSIAVAEGVLGDTKSAAAHLERALALQPEGEDRARAFALHQMAVLRAQQGEVEAALELYRQSFEIKERIGDAQGKAATLHQMAVLRARQGEVQAALELYRQASEIDERTGDAKGKAATLHAMAVLRAQQGEVQAALELYRQSLDIEERIGNAKGKAATLHAMADLRAQQGEVEAALELYRQSLDIEERIGNAQGKAATLANMADLAHKRKDTAAAASYSEQAAAALAQVRAWPDLVTVLGNLAVIDPERRIHWLAQAVWLCVTLRWPGPSALQRAAGLFHALPNADPLELPLAALSLLVFAQHGPEDKRAEYREQAAKLIAIAAGNRGMTQESFRQWLQAVQADTGKLLQETLAGLEALAPDPWIFDRRAMLASLGGGAAGKGA